MRIVVVSFYLLWKGGEGGGLFVCVNTEACKGSMLISVDSKLILKAHLNLT